MQALRYDVEPTDTEKQTDSSNENSDLSESGGNNTEKSEDDILGQCVYHLLL